jgi:hypothetical protein
LDEYPENLSLMTLKVRLQEIFEGPESALATAKGEIEVLQGHLICLTDDKASMTSDST